MKNQPIAKKTVTIDLENTEEVYDFFSREEDPALLALNLISNQIVDMYEQLNGTSQKSKGLMGNGVLEDMYYSGYDNGMEKVTVNLELNGRAVTIQISTPAERY